MQALIENKHRSAHGEKNWKNDATEKKRLPCEGKKAQKGGIARRKKKGAPHLYHEVRENVTHLVLRRTWWGST